MMYLRALVFLTGIVVKQDVHWLFKVLRPAQEYFIYMEMSPLPVKGRNI
jgi:hypothetical protein